MKLIIDIDEEDYKRVKEKKFNASGLKSIVTRKIIGRAVYNGIPLPKGHGRLGDLDILKKEMQNYLDDCAKTSEYTRLGFETAIAVVEDTDTVIEADEGK